MTAQEIFDLAMCYYSGTNGLEKDMDKYVELLEEAASLEHVEAAYLLACWYEWKDPYKAYEYCSFAAARDHIEAMKSLSMMLDEARGCERDQALSSAWWNIAECMEKHNDSDQQ